jgi:hypothetical protein
MKARREPRNPHGQVSCPACLTHLRPLGVPWEQHAIGCAVRAAALRREAPVDGRARVTVGVA